MIKNYLKTAWRNLLQNKSTSVISIAGLAVGICSFLLLATYLINELRYDRFHQNADNIVRVAYSYKSADDKEGRYLAVTQTAVVPVYKQEFSEIADGVRVFNYTRGGTAVVKYNDKFFSQKNILAADASFFKIFSFKFLEGSPLKALADPAGIVITQSTAKKYFGTDDPMGKTLQVDETTTHMVTGVIEDVPAYSQIKFDLLMNAEALSYTKELKWSSASNYSYLLLKRGANVKALESKMDGYIANILKEQQKTGAETHYTLEPLTKVHLYSTALYGLETPGNIKYIYILGIVAVVLLVLACVNFLNLVTARSAERAREIGVRKVMGALRGQLFVQFILEAGIVTLCSILGGVLLLAWLFPLFSTFTGQQLGFNTWNITWLAEALLMLFVLVTLLAGTYPSLFLSAFKPITTLKGKSGAQAGGNMLRKSLVVFQFVVSVFFIISTLIAGNQLRYIQSLDTGINRSQVVVLDIGTIPFNSVEAFKSEVNQQSGVSGSTASYDSPINVQGGYSINTAEGKAPDYSLSVTAIPIEKSFVKTLGIKLLAGADLNLGDEQQVLNKDAEKRIYSFILNEKAAKALGWKPEEAVGKKIGLNGRMGTIKAVTTNFNFASLHKEVTPIVMFAEYDWFGKLLIKTSGKNTAATLKAIEAQWKGFYPNKPFEFRFLDQEFDEMYKADQHTGSILTAFTVVTVFISCLGLFGLAVFSTRQRIKEIGIRKVLGANVLNIVGLISSDFLKLVVVAFVIASPMAWYAMGKWLQDFAFRIDMQLGVFLLAGGMAILIAFITVGYQSIKAALSNPVKSLRSE